MSGQPAHVGERQRIVGVDWTVGDDQDRFPRRIAADGFGRATAGSSATIG